MIDANTLKTAEKFKHFREAYIRYLYRDVVSLPCEICEIPTPEDIPEEREKFVTGIPDGEWRNISIGEKWGGDFAYAFFRTEYIATEWDEGKELLLYPYTNAPETLLYINGKPAGIFDVCDGNVGNSARLHNIQPLGMNIKAGERFDIVLECYAGHPSPGAMPHDDDEHQTEIFYPVDRIRKYKGVKIVEADRVVADFLLRHQLTCQLLDSLPRDSAYYAEVMNAIREVFAVLSQHPWEREADYHEELAMATEILKRVIDGQENVQKSAGYIGLIGHSHLDTAWQWPVRETLHKAARTFSNALRLMERYPDYRFVQSSVVYIDWMKKYYPDIYEGIKTRTAEGRWEPNGGAWVEFDNNIPNGEFIIRQFLYGQRYTRENLGYMSDSFWEPDTFGYSAALPQILKGCGIKYFLTTKLSWNEANKFPHDTFIWRGIDGSEVLSHFNIIGTPADVSSVMRANNSVCHRDVANMKLLSYGFGDGGGGPSYSMQEYAELTKKVPLIPRTEDTTVSAFMQKLEKEMKEPPVFSGELYLELHRGTLTQMHGIKRSNRLLEKAIRCSELLSVMAEEQDTDVTKQAIDTLLINQFHDILPGTCIEDAHKVAIYQNYREIDKLAEQTQHTLVSDGNDFVLLNTLSWKRNGQCTVDDIGIEPDGCILQRYTDLDGKARLAFSGVELAPMSVKTVKSGRGIEGASPFKINGTHISTPFAELELQDGMITSYICHDGFEAVRDSEKPFNTLWCGEDIPAAWDNWDIDYDQQLKMKPITEILSQEIVSHGALQLRIRVKKKLGEHSMITQDIVFYADSPRIDFESVVDWQEEHMLLKAGFDVNVYSKNARYETQFGYVERPTHENYGTDKSQFEVCNHKWTDLCDNRFGVAVLNDCKYGISVKDSDMRLTLMKGGTHPDSRADRGVHSFAYSLLVHESAFSAQSVIRPAYEMNYPVLVHNGTSRLPERSLLSLDADNVIVEAVKNSEDKKGIIVRLYEAERTHANCVLKYGDGECDIYEANMLEDIGEQLPVCDNKIKLCFKPFEIKTLYIEKR